MALVVLKSAEMSPFFGARLVYFLFTKVLFLFEPLF